MDAAWAAGVLESGAQITPWRDSLVLRIRKKNPDTLFRVHEPTGIGAVLDPDGDKQERFTYRADGEEIAELVKQLRPYFSAPWFEATRATIYRVLGIDVEAV